jgi:hypothetical protein
MCHRVVKQARNNKKITNNTRIDCTFKYLANSTAFNIATAFVIPVSEVFKSVWEIVDALNKPPDLAMTYPDRTIEQEAITAAF